VFAIRVAAFIISLLLVTGAVATEQGWFIALTVFTGLSVFGWSGAPRIYIGPRSGRLGWQDER
jgi:hypothetical protein